MILDEPTSALDVNAEKHLFDCIFDECNITHEKIVMLVTHRLSYAAYASKVLFLKDGQLLSFEDHNNLLIHCDEYRKLQSIQSN